MKTPASGYLSASLHMVPRADPAAALSVRRKLRDCSAAGLIRILVMIFERLPELFALCHERERGECPRGVRVKRTTHVHTSATGPDSRVVRRSSGAANRDDPRS